MIDTLSILLVPLVAGFLVLTTHVLLGVQVLNVASSSSISPSLRSRR